MFICQKIESSKNFKAWKKKKTKCIYRYFWRHKIGDRIMAFSSTSVTFSSLSLIVFVFFLFFFFFIVQHLSQNIKPPRFSITPNFFFHFFFFSICAWRLACLPDCAFSYRDAWKKKGNKKNGKMLDLAT